jgi:type IV pilus assembly protein PilX
MTCPTAIFSAIEPSRHPWRGSRLMRVRPQHGAALIIAMILLLIMSLLAATSLRETLMQERMSSNTYDRDLAFQSAEAGLRMGEQRAEKLANDSAAWKNCQSPNSEGLYQNTDSAICTQPLWEGPAPGASGSYWHNTQGVSGDDVISFNNEKLSLAPYYIVELISTTAPCQINNPSADSSCKRFRVTASSRTDDGRARVILQSIYATE